MSFSKLTNCPFCNTQLNWVKTCSEALWPVGYCDNCGGTPTKCNKCGTTAVVDPNPNMCCPSCGENSAGVFLAPSTPSQKF